MITYRTQFHEADWHLIREEVFMKEQGFQNEFDDIDQIAVHLVLYHNDTPLGCGRIYPDAQDMQTWHLGRVCVLPQYRKDGMGKRLISALELEAKTRGAKQMILSAQLQAKPFYEKCGYEAYGDCYPDEHVLHQDMKKVL